MKYGQLDETSTSIVNFPLNLRGPYYCIHFYFKFCNSLLKSTERERERERERELHYVDYLKLMLQIRHLSTLVLVCTLYEEFDIVS